MPFEALLLDAHIFMIYDFLENWLLYYYAMPLFIPDSLCYSEVNFV